MEKTRVLGICGSLRRGSYNRKLLSIAENYAALAGADVETLDLKELALPLYDQDIEDNLPESVSRLKRGIERCDALLIASPEYNYSIPAPLKNAIDWASRNGNSFKGKVGAIFGTSTGTYGAVRGQAQLRLCLSCVDVLLLPQPQVMIGNAEEAFGEDGSLADEKHAGRLRSLVSNTIALAREMKRKIEVP